MGEIFLAYAGVHQIFQLALAAQEMGELDALFCSLVDGPGKWGGKLRRWVPAGTVRPLGVADLPPERMVEYPWPLLANRLGQKLIPARRSAHLHSNAWFDRAAARWLRSRNARLFVGAETCALESLRAAGERGMKRVLDCPGIPSQVLETEEQKAAARCGIKIAPNAVNAAMAERKRQELASAEVVLCCSEFQRDQLTALNPQVRRSEVIPLWVDVDFWQPCVSKRVFAKQGEPLRILYAGALSLRKGVPYLLEAVEPLEKEVSLTLVGAVAPEMKDMMKRFRAHRMLPYLPKEQLRDLYLTHDVLVMPTLGDSFGFVTVEAMASGMPVISSQHAGAPVPDAHWRVPVHDAEAIQARLAYYLTDRSRLVEDGARAAAFAADFRPEHYRAKVRTLFQELLAA